MLEYLNNWNNDHAICEGSFSKILSLTDQNTSKTVHTRTDRLTPQWQLSTE